RAQRSGFALGEANRAAVAEVVRMLDGLPLAIELAAARIRTMSPEQLALRMRDRFAILAGARGVAARQATMRAAIDWSWELLSPWEQDAFAQCSVFDGGFTLEAAEAVLDLARWRDAPPAMDVVQALCDKSLLRTWVPAAQVRYALDEPLFGMYLSIREYAAEKLAGASDMAHTAQVRHGGYFARFGSDEETEALFLHGGVRRRHALALEIENLVAACRRATARGDGVVAAATVRVACDILEFTGPYSLGVELGAQVLGMAGLDDGSRAAVLAARGMALRRAGRIDDAAAALEAALALYRALHDQRREAFLLLSLGNVLRDQGRHDDARKLQETALAITREVGYRRVEGHALGNLGIIHACQGRYSDARRHFEEALAIHREVGNRYIEGIETSNLGNVCRESGSHDEARHHFERALAIDLEVGNRRDEGIVTANLGLLAGDLGRYDEARARFESALPVAREVGDPSLEAHILNGLANALRNLGCIDDARAALRAGEARFLGVGAAPSRVSLLCDWAELEAAAGDSDAARAKLAEAASVLEASGMGIDSAIGRRFVKVRETLATLRQGLPDLATLRPD
ncbi:MAG: tetratricopeptide repeat protein, partial [Burkholderiales bacterium]|nr:tetratricopeptide repeat protein [Burkholderiales bacterium]